MKCSSITSLQVALLRRATNDTVRSFGQYDIGITRDLLGGHLGRLTHLDRRDQ
jgi:hypothetical protein